MQHNNDASGPAQGVERIERLFRDLDDIAFTEIALVIVFAWLAVRLGSVVLRFVGEQLPSRFRLYLLGAIPLSRLLLIAGAILWIIPLIFNVSFQNFLVIAGAASVAIGFAFKEYVSSLIAGVVAVFEKPYRPGDWVRIDDNYGEVQEVGLRAITLRTADDDTVTLPQQHLWTRNIVNANDGEHTLMCVASFRVMPSHDPDRVRNALEDVALTSAYLDFDRPIVVILEQTAQGTHYRLKAYPFDMRDQFLFISDLTARGKRALAACDAEEVALFTAATGGRQDSTLDQRPPADGAA